MRSMIRVLVRLALVLACSGPLWALDLSERDKVSGLKEALVQGAGQAVTMLSKPDGFLGNPKVRIPLPDTLEKAAPVLRSLGMGRQLDELVTTMNRAAEAAVPETRGLLEAAVKQMSVTDVQAILTGGDDAGTRYFKDKTSGPLFERLLPIVTRATEKLELTKRYEALTKKAARAKLIKEEDARIDRYVTGKALDGLYRMIAEEERAIRRNPAAAAGNLARKVFGAL